MSSYTHITLSSRPKTHITPHTFKAQSLPLPSLPPAPHHALLKVLYLSIEPAMRAWLDDIPSYLPPVQLGHTMRAFGIARVTHVGPDSTREVGDVVTGMFGWTEYVVVDDSPKNAQKVTVPPGASLLDLLGVLGTSGLTAYFGLTDVGQLPNYPLSLPYRTSSGTITKNTSTADGPGPTIVISGAAGAVGSTACQLARALYGPNAHIIGIASSSKLHYLTSELGGGKGGVVDVAIDYRAKDFRKALRAAVALGDEKKKRFRQKGNGKVSGEGEEGELEKGKGVDVFFDNVGGQVLNTVLPRMAVGGRVVLCGAISDYNTLHPQGLTAYKTLIPSRVRMEGFIILDYLPHFAAARAHIAKLIQDEESKDRAEGQKGVMGGRRFTIVRGVENAPQALGMLFEGGNIGKMVVKVAKDEPELEGASAGMTVMEVDVKPDSNSKVKAKM